MSELKMHHINEVMDMHNLTRGKMGFSIVYYADDVDKVIAELEERIVDGDKDFEMANDQNERLLKIVRHQKYKRCLAMALWCESKVYHIRRTPLCDMSEHEYWQYEDEFWQRWQNRWQEIAEKFKEVK